MYICVCSLTDLGWWVGGKKWCLNAGKMRCSNGERIWVMRELNEKKNRLHLSILSDYLSLDCPWPFFPWHAHVKINSVQFSLPRLLILSQNYWFSAKIIDHNLLCRKNWCFLFVMRLLMRSCKNNWCLIPLVQLYWDKQVRNGVVWSGWFLA